MFLTQRRQRQIEHERVIYETYGIKTSGPPLPTNRQLAAITIMTLLNLVLAGFSPLTARLPTPMVVLAAALLPTGGLAIHRYLFLGRSPRGNAGIFLKGATITSVVLMLAWLLGPT